MYNVLQKHEQNFELFTVLWKYCPWTSKWSYSTSHKHILFSPKLIYRADLLVKATLLLFFFADTGDIKNITLNIFMALGLNILHRKTDSMTFSSFVNICCHLSFSHENQ